MYAQLRLRSADASAQFGQSLRCPQEDTFSSLDIQNAPIEDDDQTAHSSSLGPVVQN